MATKTSIGAEVNIGVSVIGMVAKKVMLANLGAQSNMQAIKQQIKPSKDAAVDEEISLQPQNAEVKLQYQC